MIDLARMAEDIAADALSPAAFDGKSLGDAFYELVIQDGRFFDTAYVITRKRWQGLECHASWVGHLFPSRSGFWPAYVEPYELMNGWFSRDHREHGEEVTNPADPEPIGYPWYSADDELELFMEAEVVIGRLLRRFLAPLRAGTVVALGHADRGNYQPVPILSGLWSRPDTRLDVYASAIHQRVGWDVETIEREGTTRSFRYDRLIPEFSNVTLSKVETASLGAGEPKQEPRSKGGVDPTYSWNRAFDAAFRWMVDHSFPHTGAELCDLVEDALITIDGHAPDRDYLKKIVKGRNPDLWRFVTRKSKPDFSAVPITLKPKRIRGRKKGTRG